MATADFSNYLDVPVEDIEAPLPPPDGHYFATIKAWTQREVDFKQGDGPQAVISLLFTLTSPDTDVDETALPKGGVAGKLVSRDYSLSDGSGQSMLRTLGEDTLDLPVKGHSLRDLLNMLPSQEVKVFIQQRAGKGANEGKFYADVKKVLAPH